MALCLQDGTQCIRLEDQFGPHKTEHRCEVRLEQMRDQLPLMMPVLAPMLFDENGMNGPVGLIAVCKEVPSA